MWQLIFSTIATKIWVDAEIGSMRPSITGVRQDEQQI